MSPEPTTNDYLADDERHQELVDKRYQEAVDWLLSSRWTADPVIQDAFWGYVEGRYTLDDID